MAEKTSISWCHHTFNHVIGCARVAPGCVNCYAEAFAKRYNKAQWGVEGTRVKTSADYWKQPIKWNRKAAQAGERQRVFCASLADVFEDWQGSILNSKGKVLWRQTGIDYGYDVDDGSAGWAYGRRHVTMDDLRRDLFALIDATPNLDWLILTKRPENIRRMIEACGSTGYNLQHEQSGRTIRLSSGDFRGAGNRQSGSNLAVDEADLRPLDQGSQDNALQEGSCGDGQRERLSSGAANAGRKENLRSCAPLSLDSLQRNDTGRVDGQSQEGDQVGQPAIAIGASNVQRTETARPENLKCSQERAERREAPQDEAEGFRRSGDSQTATTRKADQGNCRVIRDENPRDQRDLLSANLGSSSVSSFYRRNVWLLTSIATQADADKNIPELLTCRDLVPVLGVSAEPLIEAVNLTRLGDTTAGITRPDGSVRPLLRYDCLEGHEDPNYESYGAIDWVIAGSESGPNSRVSDIAFHRSLLSQCRGAGVAFFEKQLGATIRIPNDGPDTGLRCERRDDGHWYAKLKDPKGGDMSEWPEDLRVREFPNVEALA